jgi:glucose-6-phosphate-specific signal transduction histidine kinase
VTGAAQPVRKRRVNPIAVLVRVVVITIAFGVLGGGLGVLMGIIGISVINLAGEHTDMGMALFVGALPGLVIGAAVGMIIVISSERKALRQAS